ncbi:YolD-like family protein [Bacillus spongiae]|uniref:YolD-like family protein n=1 Tax=Bacillus spongiae TaxID=2683610 RepID=A0ABU8HG09_9BACI
MIRDRGKMKWTSMMLPEHVKQLRDWSKEDAFEKEKEMDEQQLEEMNTIAAEAMEYGSCITITHYAHHRYESLVGTIHYWDVNGEKLHFEDQSGNKHYIWLKHIVDLRMTNESNIKD